MNFIGRERKSCHAFPQASAIFKLFNAIWKSQCLRESMSPLVAVRDGRVRASREAHL